MSKKLATVSTELPSKATALEWAEKTFTRLRPLWLKGLEEANDKNSGWLYDDFWKAGNTLDAYINFLVAADKEDVDGIVEQSNLFFKYITLAEDKKGHWRDDWGWWGNAFISAYRHADRHSLNKTLCLEEAKTSWKILLESAETSAAFKTDQRFIGEGYAVWNGGGVADYVESPTTYYQTPNTVTNAGFWSLTLSLHEIIDQSGSGEQYLNSARKTFDWLYEFYNEPSPEAPNPSMLRNDKQLILETPNPDVHPRWCIDGFRDRAWSADQGVILYSAYRALALEPEKTARHDQLEVVSNKLVWALLMSPHILFDDQFILHEYPTDPPQGGDHSNFNNNYCTGPGVLMRYLSYSRPHFNDPNFFSQMKNFVVATAKSAWEKRDVDTDQIGCFWKAPLKDSPYGKYYGNPNNEIWDFALQTSGLDLFTALLKL